MILVPYTQVHPLTRQLVDQHCPDAVFRAVNPDTENGYGNLLREVWQQPGDLIIVEHDIGVHDKVIPRFLDCDQPWCGHAYNVAWRQVMALGCTRFSAGLKEALPDLMNDLGHWRQIDGRLENRLHELGHVQHRHYPDVHHFHRYDAP